MVKRIILLALLSLVCLLSRLSNFRIADLGALQDRLSHALSFWVTYQRIKAALLVVLLEETLILVEVSRQHVMGSRQHVLCSYLQVLLVEGLQFVSRREVT